MGDAGEAVGEGPAVSFAPEILTEFPCEDGGEALGGFAEVGFGWGIEVGFDTPARGFGAIGILFEPCEGEGGGGGGALVEQGIGAITGIGIRVVCHVAHAGDDGAGRWFILLQEGSPLIVAIGVKKQGRHGVKVVSPGATGQAEGEENPCHGRGKTLIAPCV